MLLFIGGAARTGKGILVRRLLDELRMPYLSLDVLKMGLTRGVPEYDIDPDAGGICVGERLWPLVREMSASLLLDNVNYVIEGEVLPKHVDALRQAYPLQVKACFLGYTQISPEQKLREIRMHPGYPNDWSSSYADADLLNVISRMIAFSRYLMAECARYDLPYFDTSHNFTQTLAQVVAYVRAGHDRQAAAVRRQRPKNGLAYNRDNPGRCSRQDMRTRRCLVQDEATLIAQAQQGDKAALAALVAAYQDTVYNVALRMCGNAHDAEETLQETFLSVMTALPRFEGRSRLSTWLYRIASNACLMRRRAAAHAPEVISVEQAQEAQEANLPRYFVDWSGLPEAALLDAELHGVMEAAIAQLPPDLRIVFIWRDLEGLSTAETAEAVGISEANVKVRLHRARMQLREALSAYFAGKPTAAPTGNHTQ